MKVKCPLIGKECIKEACSFWVSVDMQDPITKKLYIDQKCAVVAIPPMLVELIGKTNSVGAAVENSRNESVKRQDALIGVFQRGLINGSG